MLPFIQHIAQEYKASLQKLYGTEFAGLVLFGSYARGDYHGESDIDFAVILSNPVINAATEIFKTAPLSTQLSLKFNIPISTLPLSLNKMKTSMQGVYQEIRREGIMI